MNTGLDIMHGMYYDERKKETLDDKKYVTFKVLFIYSLCCSSSGC